MSRFFSALKPWSTRSGIPLSAAWQGSSHGSDKEMPDLTLDLIVPFLWRQDLSVIDGIYHTFWVLYGDHFDEQYGLGVGRKGVLDYTFLSLIARRLKANAFTSKEESGFLDALSLVFASAVRGLYFGVALLFTLVLTPIVVLVTVCRAMVNWLQSPAHPQPETAQQPLLRTNSKEKPISMSVPEAMAAFVRLLRMIEDTRLLVFVKKENLALVHVLTRLNPDLLDDEGLQLIISNRDQLTTEKTIVALQGKWIGTKNALKTYVGDQKAESLLQSNYRYQHPEDEVLRLFMLIRREKREVLPEKMTTVQFEKCWEETTKPKLLAAMETDFKDIFPKSCDAQPHPRLLALLEMGKADILNDPQFVRQEGVCDRIWTPHPESDYF